MKTWRPSGPFLFLIRSSMVVLTLSAAMTSLARAVVFQDTGRAAQERSSEAKPVVDNEPDELLKKAVAAYTAAKTYAGSWSYTQQRGASSSRLLVEIKVKSGKKALFRAAPPVTVKNGGVSASAPSVAAILDGKTAWFESADDAIYYKLIPPKDYTFSPLIFFPQMNGVRNVKRLPDVTTDSTTVIVLQGESSEGNIITLVLDSKTYHLKTMSSEIDFGGIKSITTLQVDKEVFDGEISDSVFAYKSPKGFKEIPPPPGAGAVFGLPG